MRQLHFRMSSLLSRSITISAAFILKNMRKKISIRSLQESKKKARHVWVEYILHRCGTKVISVFKMVIRLHLQGYFCCGVCGSKVILWKEIEAKKDGKRRYLQSWQLLEWKASLFLSKKFSIPVSMRSFPASPGIIIRTY